MIVKLYQLLLVKSVATIQQSLLLAHQLCELQRTIIDADWRCVIELLELLKLVTLAYRATHSSY